MVSIIHCQPTSHGGESTLSRNVGQSFSSSQPLGETEVVKKKEEKKVHNNW